MRSCVVALLCLVCCGTNPEPAAPDFEPLIQAEDDRRADAPALPDAVASPDARLRARAAVAYGRIAQSSCIEPLLLLLADPAAQVRQSAAFALGQLGWHAEALGSREAELSTRLAALFPDEDAGVRRAAIEAVGKLGFERAPTLLGPLLKTRDALPEVRAEAALALFRARMLVRTRNPAEEPAALPDAVMTDLLALAEDGDALVRRSAIYYFARHKDARGLEAARRLVRDSDAMTRMFAVQALKRMNDAGALDAVLLATAASDYQTRVAAVQALAGLGQVARIPDGLVTDPAYHVRVAVAEAYGTTDKTGESALITWWNDDPSFVVRAAALSALATRRKAAAAPMLAAALTHESPLVREAAVRSAGVLGSGAEAIQMQALGDRSETVRVAALEALGPIAQPWAFAAIQAALRAPGLAERGTAVSVLLERKEPEKLALAAQTYEASGGRRWIEVRQGLIDVYASELGAESERLLRAALRDPEPAVLQKARQVLKDRGATDLPEVPLPVLSHSPYRSRRFAENPIVRFETSRGAFEVEGFAQAAPIHVASLVGLVEAGVYDGLPWHRVVSNFVIQGGDPEGSGWGDAGYSLRAEINDLRFERGALGMPRGADFDSGGSQLFFTHIPTPHLDGQYTVFGRIRSGLPTLDLIEQGDRIVSARLVAPQPN